MKHLAVVLLLLSGVAVTNGPEPVPPRPKVTMNGPAPMPCPPKKGCSAPNPRVWNGPEPVPDPRPRR